MLLHVRVYTVSYFPYIRGRHCWMACAFRFDSRLIRDGTPETRSSTASGELTPSSGFPSKAIPPMSRALTATGTKDAALQVGKIEPDRRTDQAVTAVTPSSRRARVGYLIMTSGMDELQKTKRLLKVIATRARVRFTAANVPANNSQERCSEVSPISGAVSSGRQASLHGIVYGTTNTFASQQGSVDEKQQHNTTHMFFFLPYKPGSEMLLLFPCDVQVVCGQSKLTPS